MVAPFVLAQVPEQLNEPNCEVDGGEQEVDSTHNQLLMFAFDVGLTSVLTLL